MKSTQSDLGKRGEKKAICFLEEKGYTIVEKNFRSKAGEIDIICEREDTLSFCEVKTWNRIGMEGIEYAMNFRKRKRIIDTSKYFLYKNPRFGKYSIRYDIILIENNCQDIEHLENAFSEGGYIW